MIRGGMASASTLAFIHTGHVLIPVFGQLAKELLLGVDVFHMLDESLIRNTIASGGLTKLTIRRLLGMIESARQGGADAVMVTCSSYVPEHTRIRAPGRAASTAP